MDTIEAFSLLFADSFMGGVILPPHSPYVLKVMHGFGGYSPLLMLLCVGLGMVLAMTVNWLLGRALITCRDKEWVLVKTPRVDKCAAVFKQYLAWLLVLAWFPVLGPVLSVVAGFAKVRVFVLWFWTGVGIFGFYGLLIFA